MSLSSVSIRRPVFATVLSLAIIIFGLIGLSNLGVREFPSYDPPFVSVVTNYPGADASIIQNQVTEPLEDAINSVDGIRTMTSISSEGRSTVQIEFAVGMDLEAAANDVRDQVSRAVGRLPPDINPPLIQKADSDRFPVIALNVFSTERSLLDLTDFADRFFRQRLQTIPGVAQVDIWGAREYSIRLLLDPQLLAAYDLTALDVRRVLQQENVELPSGRIEGQHVDLRIRTESRLNTAEEFNDLVLREDRDAIVRLRDVGRAELMALNDRTVLRREGIPMVAVVLRPQPGSNQVEISDEFYRRLEALRPDLPEDIRTALGFDSTVFVRQSIEEVRQTILIAFVLVVLIIFLFLREWRTTLIPFVVIPISLIGSFFFLFLAGFSINVLTLLGLVLAIGLVVDDTIVVVENIYAKIEQGMDPLEAGLVGIKEIFLAVVATTLALIAVFLPLFFLGGITGQLFREFALVLGGAVVISSFVALTLTPMVAVKLLGSRTKKEKGFFYRRTEPFFEALTRGYRSVLGDFLKVRWLAFPVLAVALVLILLFYQTLEKELAPLEDRSSLIVRASAPQGATFDFMDGVMLEVDRVMNETVPEVAASITVTSPGFGASTAANSGFARVRLVPQNERERSQQEIARELNRQLRSVSEARIFVAQDPTIGDRRAGPPVQFVLQAPSLESLEAVLPEFMEKARASDHFDFVDVNLDFNRPELAVSIDRERARTLGVSAREIAETLQATLGEQRFGFFLLDGKQYQIIGDIQRDLRSSPGDLRWIHVRSQRGDLIPLANLIETREGGSPPQLFRFDRFSAATVSAVPADGVSLGAGIAEMRRIAREVLPDGFATSTAGTSRDFEESADSLVFVFIFALVLVYLVLAAQFESFRDPFIIMLTVPLALSGGLFGLWYFQETLNIFSQIGLILLIGLITKNGILIVEFANQRKARGLSRFEAVVDAAAARFRPVIMTSLSTILGVLPLALALGAGAESRVSMGVAVISGLIIGSFFTLFVIPSVYTFLSSPSAPKTLARVAELEKEKEFVSSQ